MTAFSYFMQFLAIIGLVYYRSALYKLPAGCSFPGASFFGREVTGPPPQKRRWAGENFLVGQKSKISMARQKNRRNCNSIYFQQVYFVRYSGSYQQAVEKALFKNKGCDGLPLSCDGGTIKKS